MTTTSACATLFDEFDGSDKSNGPQERTQINRTLWFVDRGGARVVFRWYEPLYRFPISDTLCVRLTAVQVRLGGLATQPEVARAFGHSVATQRRWESQYQKEGLQGLERKKSTGRPPRAPVTSDVVLRKWFSQDISNREMARRLGVSDTVIHRALARLGLRRRPRASAKLPWPDDPVDNHGSDHAHEDAPRMPEVAAALSEDHVISPEANIVDELEFPCDATPEFAELTDERIDEALEGPDAPAVLSFDTETLEDVRTRIAIEGFTIDIDPDDRTGDRGLARLGQLEDAIPLFKDRPCLARAGVLLAIPLLWQSGLLETFSRVYHTLGPAFYGLRTTVVVLFLSALLRIKRPEGFKEYNAQELGHVMGLDRTPEVKTVRRKLSQMAALKLAGELMHERAKDRIAEDPDRVAFLYLDGHVRPYHGHHPLTKTKKSQNQVAKPAATDNWLHDAYGEPLLVVTSEMNEGLTQVLEPILKDVKKLVGERRTTVIFDRGGYSPKLFVRLNKLGFDVMTYRKGKTSPWPLSHFASVECTVDGRTYQYELAERKRVRVGRLRPKGPKGSRSTGPQYLWMREVRVLRVDGRQTAILATRKDLPAAEVPYHQFNRWRQENFFKYMDAEFELDALVEYDVQPVADGRDRPNPARRPVEKALAAARARAQGLRADLGQRVGDQGQSSQRTMHAFKVAHAKLRAELVEAEREVARLTEERDALPKRVPADDVKTLTTEKKLIVDTIKMAAYQVETQLLALLCDHYCRTEDEGRTFLHAAFQSTARIQVSDDELRVELAPQSSPHRTEALRRLCDELNLLSAKFPGSPLRLCLGVAPHEPLRNPRG